MHGRVSNTLSFQCLLRGYIKFRIINAIYGACVYSEEFWSHWSIPPLHNLSYGAMWLFHPVILQHPCSVSSTIIHHSRVPSEDLEHSLAVWGRVSEWANGWMNSCAEFLASQWNTNHPLLLFPSLLSKLPSKFATTNFSAVFSTVFFLMFHPLSYFRRLF
jgi:hypothetical protein